MSTRSSKLAKESSGSEGASAFPPPSPCLPKTKPEASAMDTAVHEGEEALQEGEGSGRKRKHSKKDYGPKKKKLNLHNCGSRSVEVSPRTPVRILMELGQQRKFQVDYKFADPVKIHADADETEKMDADGDDEEMTEDIKEEVAVKDESKDENGGADEKSAENGDGDKDIAENGNKSQHWARKWARRFSCDALVQGVSYTGTGHTKAVAKNMAAEEALKALVVAELSGATVPWGAIACLGLYKVFTEWEAQGAKLEHLLTDVKQTKASQKEEVAPQRIQTIITTPGLGPQEPMAGAARDAREPKGRKKDGPKVAGRMPPDPTSRHPVQLLNELHPGLDFVFVTGGENNYDCTVNVESVDFHCKGNRTKKEAKKAVALEALKVLYNVAYPEGSPFA